MTFYFAGGEMGAFTPSDVTSFESTTSGYRNTSFARASIICDDNGTVTAGPVGGQYAESAIIAPGDECYYHYDSNILSGSSGNVSISLELHNGTTGVFRVIHTESGGGYSTQMQAKIGGTYTNVGSAFAIGDGTQTFDLYIDGNSATGTAKLYVAGTRRATATSVDLSAVTGITKLRSYGTSSAGGTALSQVIVSSEPTIGFNLSTVYPSGAGATNTFVGGAYTDIDESVYSDADFAYADTNGQIFLVAGTSVASMTDKVVRAVVVTSRAKCGAGGPQNMQHVLRVSGADYVSSTIALDVGYDSYCSVWATNPATGIAWTVADLASPQFGVKAIT